MSILRFLFYAFLLYLAYKLVFDFIIPVYRTTRQVKKSFREMQERMQQPAEPFGQASATTVQDHSPNKNEGDYIEFEEVR